MPCSDPAAEANEDRFEQAAPQVQEQVFTASPHRNTPAFKPAHIFHRFLSSQITFYRMLFLSVSVREISLKFDIAQVEYGLQKRLRPSERTENGEVGPSSEDGLHRLSVTSREWEAAKYKKDMESLPEVSSLYLSHAT